MLLRESLDLREVTCLNCTSRQGKTAQKSSTAPSKNLGQFNKTLKTTIFHRTRTSPVELFWEIAATFPV